MSWIEVRSGILFYCLVSLLPAGSVIADEVVFSTDFDSGIPTDISGPGALAGVQGFAGIGHPGNTFENNFLRNASNPGQPSTLSLTGLPEHTHIDISFLLGILESWDGGATVTNAAPDIFNVRVDDETIFSHSFETTGVSQQSYVPPPGVELVHKTNMGNWGYSYPESGYDMGLDPTFQNIEHTADSLTIEWFADGAGWQGGNDESWAIDNLSVTVRGVPEPGTTTALLIAGCCVTGLRRRRARSKS